MNGLQLQKQSESACSRKQPASSLNSANVINSTDPPILNPEEEELERKNLEKIIAAFRYYRKYSYARVNKSESYLNSLPQNHQAMLTKFRKNLGIIRDCIDENQAVINKIITDRDYLFYPYPGEMIPTQQDGEGHATKIRHQDMENVQSTLKQFARDWSEECKVERDQSYSPIIEVIEELFNPDEMQLNEYKILVPGAGLGRLTYELACRGYECEGNEYSFFMMFGSHFVLNKCTEENQYTIFPWIHQYVNNLRRADQIAPIRFPDVCPTKSPPKGTMTMSAGDFLEVYKVPNIYDCVATCFFIDCANNVIEFIETIYRVLVPGGIWVNLGPLLYHYSDIPGENSIEPTYEDLIDIVQVVGFQILRNETGRRTKYAQNPQSMLKSEYESLFWVCQKPLMESAKCQSLFNGLDANGIGNNNCSNGYNSNNGTL